MSFYEIEGLSLRPYLAQVKKAIHQKMNNCKPGSDEWEKQFNLLVEIELGEPVKLSPELRDTGVFKRSIVPYLH